MPAAEREKEILVTPSSSLNGKSHAGSLLNGSGQHTPKTEAEREAELNTRRLPNLRANAQMVAKDLPDPAAAGYLLLLFDQCRLYDLSHERSRGLLQRVHGTQRRPPKLIKRARERIQLTRMAAPP